MRNQPLLQRSVLIWAAVAAFALGAPVLATTQAGPLVVSVTTSPNPEAIEGTTSVTKSVGVLGYGTGTTDVALEGYATQPGSTGLEGFENATTGAGNGVFGYSAGATGSGVYGVSNALDGYGVFGDNIAEGIGIAGIGNTNAGVYGGSSGGDGIVGESASGTGVYGKSSTYYGMQGESSSSYGVYGDTSASQSGTPAAGVGGFDLSGKATGVYGSSSGGFALYGASTSGQGVYGTSSSSYGVYGTTKASVSGTPAAGVGGFDTSGSATGTYGQSSGGRGVFGNATAAGYGVFGQSSSGNGVYGYSSTGNAILGLADSGGSGTAGVLGGCGKAPCSGVDGDTEVGTGVTAYSYSGDGLEATSNSSTGTAIYAHATGGGYGAYLSGNSNLGSVIGEPVLQIVDGNKTGDANTSLEISGPNGEIFAVNSDGSTYSANAVSAANNRATDSRGVEHQMYEPRDTEAVSEDFGEAQMTGGRAYVALDPTFADLLGHRSSYLVFITPDGDSSLYVSQKTPTGFVVEETGGGHASLAFDYRIVGKPANEKQKARMPVFVMPHTRPVLHEPEALDPARQLALLHERLHQARQRPLAQIAPRPLPALAKAQRAKRTFNLHVPPLPFVYRPDKAATR